MSDAAQRWEVFLAKVRARLREILEEATAGLEEIIATEVIDPVPVSSAESEVKARLFALRDKIDQAWSKLEPELGDDSHHLEAKGRALGDEILREAEAFEARTRRAVLARLEVLAAEERSTRRLACSKCGAPLPEPAALHRTDNVTCPHCAALNTVRPGPAMAMLHVLRPRP